MKQFLGMLFVAASIGAGCSTTQSQPAAPAVQGSPEVKSVSGSELDLSDRGLTAIPSDVFTKTGLERLDLSGNALTGAPQSQIQQLQKLKFLDLSDNHLTGLPAELGQLKRLEVLDVSNNQLTGLPMELGNLTQLRVLDLTGNNYSAQDLEQIANKLTNTEIRR